MTAAPFREKVRSSLRAFPLVFQRAVAGGIPVLIGFYIAHRWGIEEFGSYTVAAAIVTVGLVITDWGCSRSLPREIAVLPREAAADFVAATNTSRLVVFVALIVGAWLASLLSLIRADIAQYIWILAPWPAVTIWATNGVSARVVDDELGGIIVAVVAGIAATGIVVLAAAKANMGPSLVAVAIVAGRFVEALILVGRRWWLLRVRTKHAVRTLVTLWSFSIQGILLVVYSRLPLFVIEHRATPAIVGVVAAGTALQSVLLILPACTAFIALPQLSVAAREERRRIRPIVYNYLAVSFAGMALGIAVMMIFRDVMIRSLRIPESYVLFVICFAAASISTLGTAILSVLVQAFGGEAAVARASIITVGLALVFQLIFTAIFGIWGVIAGLLCSEASSLLLLLFSYFRIAARPVPRRERAFVSGAP